MNIVLLESLGISPELLDQYAKKLEQQGHHFAAYERNTDPAVQIERARDADILMIANMPLSGQVIRACKNLKFIDVGFTGVDHVDLQAAKEMGVGGVAASVDDDYDTVMGATFKIQLDDWKDDSKDDWYNGAELEDLLDFRTNVSAAFAEHKISEKEANDIMTDSAPAMLHKINEYIDDGNGLSRLIFGERPMRSGLQKIQGKIADMDLSDDQQLYIYEDFLRRYRRGLNNVPGDDSRDNLQQNMANTLSDDVVRDYIETQNPNWDPKSSSAIVMGRTVYRTPESQNSPIKNGLYRVVKDANGNLYKQYRDTNGNFSQKSVLQRLG